MQRMVVTSKECHSRHRSRAGAFVKLATPLCAALAQLIALPASADSAMGVDTVLGNVLNPGKPSPPIPLDPDALIASHAPSARVYAIPYALPQERKTENGWLYNGWLEFGALAGNSNENAALFRMYKDLDN